MAPAFTSVVAPLGAAWLAIGGLHLLLSRIVPGTALVHPDWTPPWIQLGLVATELSWAALGVGLGGLILAGARRLETKVPGRGTRLLVVSIPYGMSAGFLFLYFASWFSFYNLGQFADPQGLEFAWVNGSLFLAYVHATHPEALAVLPLGSIVLSSLAVWGLPRLLRRVPPARLERALRIVLGLAAACLLCVLLVELFRGLATEGTKDPITGIVHPWGRLYEVRRGATSGPLTHAAGGLLDALSPRPSLPDVRRDSAAAVRRRQVSMTDYLASVDRAAFRPRNVVLLMVDSLRPDALGKGIMPRTDELLRSARYFPDARTESSHTDYAALCPLSSQYPLRSAQVHRYPAKPPYPRVLIYDVLKALGYRTGLISSQDEHWGLMLNFLNTGGLDHLDHAHVPGSRNLIRNFRSDDLTIDRAIQWVGESAEKPFFLYLNLQNPHFPYLVPESWPRRRGKPPDFRMVMGMYPPERVAEVRALYEDSLEFADAQIGRFVDALRQRNLWSETVFVLVADHGEAFHEHQFGGHGGRIFDEVMKVPILIHGPGAAPGVDPRPAELIDVPVSICHLLGIPPHPAFQGMNLFAPDPPKERSRFMVAHTPLATQYGVERGQWKLIYDETLKLPALYDLRRDPRETRDVSREEPAILRELTRQLHEWRALQLEYYVNPARLATEYPPVLPEAAGKP